MCTQIKQKCSRLYVLRGNDAILKNSNPDSKVHGANMGPTWGRQDPGGPHVGHVNLAIWEHIGPLLLTKIV